MKIKWLKVKNFKGYKEKKFVFDSDKVVYAMCGKNGVGKTSLQQAIRFIITGDAPDNIIKKGELETTVTCELEDGTTIERTKSLTKTTKSSQKLNGKTVTGTTLNNYINSSISALPGALKIALDPNLLDNMKPEQLSDFLIKTIGENIIMEHVLHWTGSTDKDLLKMLKDYLGNKSEVSITDIENAYNAIFTERANYKKSMDKLKAKIDTVLYETPTETLESVNRRLEAIIKEEGALESAKLAVRTYDKAVEGKKKQEAYVKQLEEEIAKNTSSAPKISEIEAIRKEKDSINTQIININTVIKTMEDTIKSFKETIEKLSSAFCPLSESITCNSVKERESLKGEFEEQITAQKEGIEIQKGLLNETKKRLDSVVAKETAYNKNATEYQKKLILIKQLEEAKKSIPVLPVKPKPVTADTEELEERKRVLENLKNKIIKCNERDKDKVTYENLNKKYKILDTLVKMLAPKGIVMYGILNYYMEVFEDALNERANELRSDFKVKLHLDSGVKIECETAAGKGFVPYESLSAGEKAYAMFLFIDLCSNAITQVNIMLLDDLDKLDAEAFEALVNLLTSSEITDLYDHIFIASVNHEDSIKTLSAHSNIELNIV
jgi:DNA repair exonuclease SbcCD ATPase subunit